MLARPRARLRHWKKIGLWLGSVLGSILVSLLLGLWIGHLVYPAPISGPFGEIGKRDLFSVKGAVLTTNKGEIEIALFPREKPLTVANFVLLARNGFYDGVRFHRIVKNFVIQTGDPQSKGDDPSWAGTGGPGYTFNDELTGKENYKRGIVAMANSGANTNGSQFFIVVEDQPNMPKKYTIFGKVVSGLETVDEIAAVPTKTTSKEGEKSVPKEDVFINKITIKK